MQHVTVYKEEGMFAGWPANHGAWQRDDEFLVGFMRGKYGDGSFHHIIEPFQKVQARSLDGGETWRTEVPNVDFEAKDNNYSPHTSPPFDLTSSIIRVVGCYDTGGDHTRPEGGFYVSHDFGKVWEGPYYFRGLENILHGNVLNTSRTRVVNDTVYLSARYPKQWGSDWVFSAHHNGERFHFDDLICQDDHRAVMPDVAKIGDYYVCAMRRKGRGRSESGNWIDVFGSGPGEPWKQLSANPVADVGFANGNPPALAAVDNRLVCCYGQRTIKGIFAKFSYDRGLTWSVTPLALRMSRDRDLGYPQLFKRSDGKLVCVYYVEHGIEACIFDPLYGIRW